MAELPRERGWYRLTDHGWEPVPDEIAQAEVATMAPGYLDLMYVGTMADAEEVPLF